MLPSTYPVEAGRNKKIIIERLELGSSLFFLHSIKVKRKKIKQKGCTTLTFLPRIRLY